MAAEEQKIDGFWKFCAEARYAVCVCMLVIPCIHIIGPESLSTAAELGGRNNPEPRPHRTIRSGRPVLTFFCLVAYCSLHRLVFPETLQFDGGLARCRCARRRFSALASMAKFGELDPRWIVEVRPDGTNVNNWHWWVHVPFWDPLKRAIRLAAEPSCVCIFILGPRRTHQLGPRTN